MPTARDTVVYELKDGNEIVYIGITNDPEGRELKHRREGKKFGHLRVASVRMTRASARLRERIRLAVYRRYHQGKNPKYNKDSDG